MTTTKSFLILATFAILTLVGCNQSESKSSATNDDKTTSSESKTEPQKVEGVFDNPSKLIETLSQNGIGELKQWENPMDMGWGSLTDYYQFGLQKDGIGMQNNIAYYLEGTETTVTNLTINLNINNAADKKNALKFLAEVAEKTFTSINLTIPSGLIKAISDSKEFKGEADGYSISNELDKSNIESWKVVIKKNNNM